MQVHQSYIYQAPTWTFEGSNSKGSNPIASHCQGLFGCTSWFPRSSSPSPISLQLNCSPHATSSMKKLCSYKVSPLIFMSSKKILKVTSWWLQCIMLSNSISKINFYKSSKCLQLSFELSSVGSPSFTLGLGIFKEFFKNSTRESSTMLKCSF